MPSARPLTGHGAAQYNNLVQCQLNKTTENTDGQKKQNWVTQFKRWAMVVPRGGSEKKVFEQLLAEVDHLVRLRNDSQTRTINPPDWRIVMPDGSILNIVSRIDVDTRRIEMEFRCVEVRY